MSVEYLSKDFNSYEYLELFKLLNVTQYILYIYFMYLYTSD